MIVSFLQFRNSQLLSLLSSSSSMDGKAAGIFAECFFCFGPFPPLLGVGVIPGIPFVAGHSPWPTTGVGGLGFRGFLIGPTVSHRSDIFFFLVQIEIKGLKSIKYSLQTLLNCFKLTFNKMLNVSNFSWNTTSRGILREIDLLTKLET